MFQKLGGVNLRAEKYFSVDRKIIIRFSVFMAIAFGVFAYIGLFMVPKRVNFSYAAPQTCTGQLAVLPELFRANNSAGFKLEYRGGLSVGGTKLTSTKICFKPTTAPTKGVTRLEVAPFGNPAFKSAYEVEVGAAPKIAPSTQLTAALNKPIVISLEQTDKIFQYYLVNDNKEQLCLAKATALSCSTDNLALKQGSTYSLNLQRRFNGHNTDNSTTINIAILPAVKVIGSTIAAGSTIFNKPKSAEITLDKAITDTKAKLEIIESDRATALTTRVKIDGVHVSLSWDDDLPREKNFKITLSDVAAADGSALESDYVATFQTSGGPKVASVNIGEGGVAANSRVIVTLDQPLAADANVAGLAKITGGNANISRQGNNQIVFALDGIPRCGAFTLSIGKGLVGEGGVISTQDWFQTSHINCRATRTIGYSVNGRPIQAYFYGSGSITILFTGGIHGDEASGSYIMQDWANYLDINGYKIPANKQVVIVPNANPDGLISNQRYNAHNVNIDRNFSTSDWIANIGLTNGQIYPNGGGATPMSEPETRALADITSSLHPRAEISFHSSGATVGANKIADSVAIGTLYASTVGYDTMFYNPEAIMGYTLTGEYETWLGESLGMPAILIELPTSTGRYFSRHLNALWRMVNL